MWYKELLVSKKEKDVIDNLFSNLKVIGVDNYLHHKWDVAFFHSRPFMEESIFQRFNEILCIEEFIPVRIFCYPFTRRTKFLCIEKFPKTFSEFSDLMEKMNFLYTGGFGYCENEKLAFVSNADTEIFSIGYDKRVVPNKISFDDIPERITREKAQELTKEHLDFFEF